MPSMRVVPAVLLVVVTFTGCGRQTGGGDASTDTVATTANAPAADDLDRFCAAVAVMDTHDGTTEASVAVAAIDEFRKSAPPAIRDDVELTSDTFVVNNYPSHAEPSMTAAPFAELDPASARLADYVETNCGPDR